MARVSLSWALILGLLAGIGPMCTDLYLPALPEMSEQLAATTTITQLTLTASLIGLGVGQLLFGPLSDKIGRKRPLILSLLLFIVSSILCATTNNIYWLVVWRFIQGIAGAGGSVLSRSIARDKYQGVTLTQFFALLMTVNGLAPVLSPVLGGYIVSTFDWRTLFWVMAEISTVLLLGCLLFIHETLPENKRGSSFLCAWIQLPIPALVALFFTIAFCSGIGTVGGAEAMSAVGTQESGTASALMGMSMFVFGGIAAPLSGIGGETLLKMSLAITVCYTLALLVALTRIDNQK
ncbi:TPA: MFS transporter [Escherichia coli]|nr:MFS transporter [Escherichia coli]